MADVRIVASELGCVVEARQFGRIHALELPRWKPMFYITATDGRLMYAVTKAGG